MNEFISSIRRESRTEKTHERIKLAEGTPIEMVNDKNVIVAYLGDASVAHEIGRAAHPALPRAESLLHIDALAAGYGEVQVVWGISLSLPRGQLTTIVGANGAGKTTTLLAIVGIRA